MHPHSANHRRVQWKHFGHRLLTKIQATIGPQNGRNHLSSSTFQGIIRNKEFHYTAIFNRTGTGQNFPRHRPSAALHHRHRCSKATLYIRNFKPSQFWPKESMHYANPELRSTRNQCPHWWHTRHPEHRKGGSDPFWRQQPRYHLWANPPTTTKNQEESMDQERNRRKMPPWSSRTISKSVYRHTGQASSSNQPGQIRPRIGQEFYPSNPPQG